MQNIINLMSNIMVRYRRLYNKKVETPQASIGGLVLEVGVVNGGSTSPSLTQIFEP